MKIKAPTGRQLVKEIESHLPLPVYATPESSRSLRKRGNRVSVDEELKVTSVFDSGDMGGILCAIENEKQEEVFVISLTHLRLCSDHLRSRSVAMGERRAVTRWRSLKDQRHIGSRRYVWDHSRGEAWEEEIRLSAMRTESEEPEIGELPDGQGLCGVVRQQVIGRGGGESTLRIRKIAYMRLCSR